MNGTDRKDIRLGCTSYIEAQKHYYVDKTLMIRDMITDNWLPQGGLVKLILRPRGSGKSLNMDMLKTFFEKTSEDTSVYFRDKNIWQCSEGIRGRQGQSPVIFISFNDVNSSTWDEAYSAIKDIIATEYMRHSEVLEGLNDYDKSHYHRVISITGGFVDYATSLERLSKHLNAYYGKKPVVLIDEYDRPVQAGYANVYRVDAIMFIRHLISAVMKDNSSNVYFGVITGTMWLTHLGSFNNYAYYTIRNPRFADSFGFTQEEVSDLLSYYGLEAHMDEICRLYGGHRIAQTELFRPADVLEYVCGLIKTG